MFFSFLGLYLYIWKTDLQRGRWKTWAGVSASSGLLPGRSHKKPWVRSKPAAVNQEIQQVGSRDQVLGASSTAFQEKISDLKCSNQDSGSGFLTAECVSQAVASCTTPQCWSLLMAIQNYVNCFCSWKKHRPNCMDQGMHYEGRNIKCSVFTSALINTSFKILSFICFLNKLCQFLHLELKKQKLIFILL